MIGASPVDFPGVHRVDHMNGSDVSRVIGEVAARFEEELDRPGNKQFLRYITSMWSKPDLVYHYVEQSFIYVLYILILCVCMYVCMYVYELYIFIYIYLL